MLTLEELEYTVTVQGNVRISFWSGDEEVVLGTTDGVTDLDECVRENDLEAYEGCGIEYIFSAPDGYLHIELDPEDVETALREQLADIINERESYPEDAECDELDEAYLKVTNLLAAFN